MVKCCKDEYLWSNVARMSIYGQILRGCVSMVKYCEAAYPWSNVARLSIYGQMLQG